MSTARTLSVLFLSAAVCAGPAMAQSSGGSQGSTSGTTTSGTQGTSGGTQGTSGSQRTTSTTQGNSTSSTATTGRFPGTNFLQTAAADSLQEVQLGTAAQTNSQNLLVQHFGQRLVTDHSLALQDAQTIATGLGLTLNGLNTTQQTEVQSLSAMTGAQFDQAFINLEIQDHIRDITRFAHAARLVENPDIAAFARQQLPVLVNHLLLALNVRDALAAGAGTGP